MKPSITQPLWLTLALALALSLFPLYSGQGFAAQPIKARNKAEFTRFMHSFAKGSSQGESTVYSADALQRRFRVDDGDGRPQGTGYIPSPINTAHMKGNRPSFLVQGSAINSAAGVRIQGVPAGYSPSPTFDLRSLGKVSPVRDQGACGDCWAFATYGSMESNSLLSQFGNPILSPNHLNVRHGFAFAPCAGGNASMAMAYLSRWGTTAGLGTGPVLESDDPYTATLATSIAGLSPRFHTQDALTLPNRASATDNLAWKYAIQQYGGAYVAFYVDTTTKNNTTTQPLYWKPVNAAYYYNGAPKANHAVTLVGWDDNYPSSNFATLPPGNGAYIIKNSWGAGWGQNGYFYISYYDTSLQEATSFSTPEPTGNYTHQFMFDHYGQIGSIGYSANTAWAGNIFTTVNKEPNLQAVSFYSNTLDTAYTVYVYTNVGSTPTAGTLQSMATASGILPFAGYHTVKLAAPVTLAAGQKFSVVIKLTTLGYNYPIPIEYAYSGYTGAVTTLAGRSFISSAGTSWYDLAASKYNANLRAYTGLSLSTIPAAIQGQAYSQALTISDGTSPYAYAVVKGNLPAGLTLSSGGVISGTPLATGTYPFTISAMDSTASTVGGPFSGARDYVLSVNTGATQQSQTITSIQVTPNPLNIGSTGSLSATASSGLPVTFSTTTPTLCTITGNTVKGIAAGSCTITGNQSGSATYLPAAQVSMTLTVQKLTQTITPITVTPATLSVKTAKTGTLTATASSSLVVTFSTNTTGTCSVSGKTVTAKKRGTCTILANQAGNATYTSAPTVQKSITVNP